MHFIIGYLLLLAMALCWSVDDSMVYILFGAAVYFLFLGFYTLAAQNKFRETRRTTARHDGIYSSFSDIVKNIFHKQGGSRAKHQGTVTSAHEANRRIVLLVVATIFATFFIFFIGSIFNASDVDDKSFVYFENAERNYWDGDYDSAYINYRKAWQLNETYVEAMVGYGKVLAVRKQLDSAMLMYDKALAINPDYSEAVYNKAAQYYTLEKYNESIAILKPLLQQQTDYYDGMLLIGDCYYSLRQYDDAITWYENAYENGGARSRALCHIMAYIYDTKGSYPKG